MKRIYFLFTLLCLSVAAGAQTAASYGFTALTSPFVSISATGTPVPTLSDDDFTEPGIPIGFAFNYCGTPYTTLSACSNGWVSLSESASADFDNIETSIDGPGWLMPFWDDMDGFSGTAYYTTTGVAPNRVFTFEWHDWELLGGIDVGSFQIKLYETTNIIDFTYGPSTMIFASATMGISNDNISDWQTLSDESTAPTALAAPLFEAFIFGSPADGQVYRWSPSSCTVAAIAGTLTTCTGGSTTLTDATAGGTWTSSDLTTATVVGTTGVVTGVAAGTATITYTASPGCFATAVVTITAPTAITGSLAVCAGLTTTLSHTTAGGTWSSGDGTIASVGATTGIVSGLAPGIVTISYTLPSGCVASASVTVNTTPAGITGATTVCQGSTSALSSATPGGTWSSSFMAIATIDAAGIVTGVLGGVTTISYTLPTGCFRTTSLTVNPLPAPITGSTALCISGTSLLSNTTAGGTWSSTTPAVATISAGGLVTGVAAGTSVISYILASGCFRTVTVSVTAVVAPIVGPTVTCRLQGASYTNTTTGGTWSSSNVAVGTINAASGMFAPLSAGTTTISYILGSGCFATTTVTVNANELITGVGTVCQGQTISMANAVAGGTWASGDISIFTVNPGTGLVTGVGAGTAAISYTTATGCITTRTMTVFATPAAISGNLLICVGNSTTLSSTTTGGTWSSSDVSVASIGLATGIATGLGSGTSTITYTSAAGCFTVATISVNPAPAAISGITVLCPNTTAFLTHPVSGGTWSSSDVSVATIGLSTGLLTGINLAGGTATITYTLPTSGCIATTIVTVNAAPAPITGGQSLCVGSTTTLSTTSIGATWSSANLPVATVVSGSGVVTGVSTGTAIITCHGTNGCFRTTTVTVNANPTPVSGTAVVCVGATTTLSSGPGGGAWSSSSGGVATVNAGGVVTGVSANTVTISYALATGCFATQVVTVNTIPTAIGGTATVCLGLTTTLTSSAGGTWTSSATGIATIGAATGVVTGIAAGTANISYTLASGCLRTRTVTVNTLPAAIGGPTSVCPGTTITLTNTSPGGAWSSGTPAAATVAAGTGVVTGVAGGTTIITYTLITGCIATTTISVIAAPIATITPIGDTVLCPGDFVTLTSSAAVGASYIWYNGGVVIPTATTPTYIASASGSYQVRVSVAAGCTTLSTPMVVSVVPATAAITVPGSSTTTCAGTPITLNANTGVGLSYQWELAGIGIAGATANTYNALIGGAYTVRVTNSAGCWAVSSPTTITVSPAPSNIVTASGPLTFCNGSTVTLSVTTGAGYTYQWFNSAGAIASATSAAYTATTAESYYATISDGSGCSATTATSVVVVNPLPSVAITPGGPRLFCLGGSVVLDAATGFNYQWYRGGIAISGAINDTYTATLAGGYRVRVTDPVTGCTAITGADTVVTTVGTVNVLPLTPARFCWGGSSLLSTNVSSLGSAITYQWYFNGVVIPGATAPNYLATVAGNYHCSISVPASCSVTTAPIAVTEVPLPDPPITFNGTTFQTGNFYTTYQWYKNLIPIPGATTWSTPATSNGNYKVAVTDTNGCQSVSSVYSLSGFTPPPPSGIVDVNSTTIKIFPNPAKMVVYIESAQRVKATVSGIDGRILMNLQDAKNIDIRQLANGVYMIAVYDYNNNILKTEKLIKVSE